MSKIELSNIVKKYSKEDSYDFTGYLMYKNEPIAIIDDSKFIKSLNDNLLPIIMLNKGEGSFEVWLQTRVIDTHRTNSRQIRRRLSVRSEVPKEIVIKARAISITDSFWLKNNNEDITYEEIRKKLSDGLNKIALYGNSLQEDFNDDNITPELTNIGSFEKCWKLLNGNWYMIKRGSYKENFAEVLVSKIANSLGFKAIHYWPLNDGLLVKCLDFTNNAQLDFEPMFSFVKDYWDIDDSIKIIEELGYINDFLNITFMDALCYNIDRHTFNFGVLRKDGELIGLAPNFDNNLALSGVLNDKNLESTWYSTSFTRHNYKPILEQYNYPIPTIDFNNIKCIIDTTLENFPTLKNEVDFSNIVLKILQNNYNELRGN